LRWTKARGYGRDTRLATILVVDDERMVRSLVVSILRQAGHDVLEASNGVEGLDVLTKSPVDLVITDIIMPEKDGVATVRDIRCSYPDTKIIAVSGGGINASDYYLGMARSAGADVVLSKPIMAPHLLAAVMELLAES